MDVGTLFGGAAGKVPKAIKAVTVAAQPLMKLFAAAGIVNGAQALGKVIRGEDVTSEDMISILRGLTSTAIGAKIVKQKIGDATLSKRLEDDVLKTQNANVKTTPEVKIGDTEIKITNDELNTKIKGKTKTDVENFLKGKVKSELEAKGIQFDEAKHGVDLSKKFGISYDKGEFEGLNWKKIFKGKGFVGRGEGKATFEPEAPAEGHSWLGHYLRPGVRRANIGYD